jgi:hypothetical protein
LSQEEIDAITLKLAEWLPAALPSDVLNVVGDALTAYAEGLSDEVVLVEEKALIARLAERWSVDEHDGQHGA